MAYNVGKEVKSTNNERDNIMCEKYNGWTNRRTWLVNLWDVVSEETIQEMVNDSTTVDDDRTVEVDTDRLAEQLQEQVESFIEDVYGKEVLTGFIGDMLGLNEVGWHELATAYARDFALTFDELVEQGIIEAPDTDEED